MRYHCFANVLFDSFKSTVVKIDLFVDKAKFRSVVTTNVFSIYVSKKHPCDVLFCCCKAFLFCALGCGYEIFALHKSEKVKNNPICAFKTCKSLTTRCVLNNFYKKHNVKKSVRLVFGRFCVLLAI